MINKIKEHGVVNAFFIVINGQQARWNAATQESLKVLSKAFPKFFDNVIIVMNFMP